MKKTGLCDTEFKKQIDTHTHSLITDLSNRASNSIDYTLEVDQAEKWLLFEPVQLCSERVLLMFQYGACNRQIEAGQGSIHSNTTLCIYCGLTGSGRTLVVVLKHLDRFPDKQDFFSHSDRNVGGKHLDTQGELLQGRSQHVLLLDQSLQEEGRYKVQDIQHVQENIKSSTQELMYAKGSVH